MHTVPNSNTSPSPRSPASPDYNGLVRFLVAPFLESSESIRVDSEVSPRTSRVLVRLAIEGEDKGRIFGRGGRNIQAIRTVLQAVARSAGQVAHLEIFGSQSNGREGSSGSSDDKSTPPRSGSRRPSRPRPR